MRMVKATRWTLPLTMELRRRQREHAELSASGASALGTGTSRFAPSSSRSPVVRPSTKFKTDPRIWPAFGPESPRFRVGNRRHDRDREGRRIGSGSDQGPAARCPQTVTHRRCKTASATPGAVASSVPFLIFPLLSPFPRIRKSQVPAMPSRAHLGCQSAKERSAIVCRRGQGWCLRPFGHKRSGSSYPACAGQ